MTYRSLAIRLSRAGRLFTISCWDATWNPDAF
jgi:hypothetical protein